ncbi:ABC transporter permease [Sphingomonas sinipercae]|uniref:ABC transporter permease n=1 Tax=Sphingomonas sinipercae TaxID=2714944 RepID=A0A6G7ZKJ1_9SPHN|nr:ABC transporter permease [Sphingomonas sinipercae]QIL01452.1 ABC transporter permease [Sphingomonas sinipercae]
MDSPAPSAPGTASSLAHSLKVEGRVIHALLMREVLTRFGRHNIGFMWMFVEPMIFTLGVTALWTITKSMHGSDLPIAAFALSGYSTVLLWRNMPTRCISAVEPNLALMYHRNVKVIDIYWARLLLEVGGATTSFVVLTIVFMGIGMIDPPEDVLQVFWGWVMIAWFGMALALLLGSLSENYEMVEKLWHPTSYLLFPLSGAAFLVDVWPEPARSWFLYLPMVNGVEYLREGFFGSRVRAHYDMAYMAYCNAGLMIMALAQIRKISREIIPE